MNLSMISTGLVPTKLSIAFDKAILVQNIGVFLWCELVMKVERAMNPSMISAGIVSTELDIATRQS